MRRREDARAAELDPEVGGAVHGAVETRQARRLAGAFEREGDKDGGRGREARVGCRVVRGRVEGEGDRGVVARPRRRGVGDAFRVQERDEELGRPAGAEDEEVDGRGGVAAVEHCYRCCLALRRGGRLGSDRVWGARGR